MQHLKIYTKQDVLSLTHVKKFETSVGERLQTIFSRGSLSHHFGHRQGFSSGFSIQRQFPHLIVGLATDKYRVSGLTPCHPLVVVSTVVVTTESPVGRTGNSPKRVELDAEHKEPVVFGNIRHHRVAVVAQPCDATVSTGGNGIGKRDLLMHDHFLCEQERRQGEQYGK